MVFRNTIDMSKSGGQYECFCQTKSITVSLNESHDMKEVEITFALNDEIVGKSGGVSFDYDKDGNIDHVFVDTASSASPRPHRQKAEPVELSRLRVSQYPHP